MRRPVSGSIMGVAVLALIAPVKAAVYSDDFESYSAGGLGGQGPWSGSTTNRVDVVSGAGLGGSKGLVITGQQSVTVGTTNNITPVTPSGNIMVATFAVQAGFQNDTSTMWSLYLNDSTGKNLARAYTGAGTIRGRIAGTGTVTPQVNLSGPGIWDALRITINTAAQTSFYELSLNGGPFGPLGGTVAGATLSYSSQGSAAQIGQVIWEATGGSTALTPGRTITFDNLTIVPEPATLVTLLLGGVCVARRRKVC